MGYFPILLAPFFALAHIHSRARARIFAFWSAVLIFVLAIIAWLNPLSFLKQFGRAIRSALNVIGIDIFPQFAVSVDKATEPLQNFLLFLKLLVFDNPIIFVFGVAGMALMLYRKPRSFATQLTAGFFFLYFLIGIFVWPHPDNRYILPLLLPIYAGCAYALSELSLRWRYAAITAVFIAGIYGAYATLSYDLLLQKSDTRSLSREWIERNAPAGSAVLSDVQYFELIKDKNSVEYLRERLPEALRQRDAFATDEGYLWLDVQYMNKLKNPPEFDYFVVGFYDPKLKPAAPSGYSLAQTFYPRDPDKPVDELLDNPVNSAVAVSAVDRLGPYIEIYRREQ